MKNISFFVLLLLGNMVAHAQDPAATITCHYKGVTAGTITVIIPVNNNIYWASSKELPVAADGTCKIALSKNQTGYVEVRGFDKSAMAFVQPGDKLIFEIDTAANKGAITISGNNAAGQQLITDGKLPTSYFALIGKFQKDSTVGLITNHVQQEKDEKLALFTPLLKQGKINQSFFDFAKLTLDYTYAAVEGELFAAKFYPTSYPPEHPAYNPVFPQDYAKAWENVYAKFPVNKEAVSRIPSFESYLDHYMNAFLSYKKWQDGDTSKARVGNDYAQIQVKKVRDNFTGSIKEYSEATVLYSIYVQQRFEKVLPELFADFQKEYPRSAYTQYLTLYNDKVIAYYKATNASFSADQHVIENYSSINSFTALTEKFKGKMFFIDMWATWCRPCKAEFEFKDGLHDYLKQKNIPMLYISMDDDKKDEQWKVMIKYYGLKGYHVRTSDSLRNDLIKIFWNGDGYAIPRYVLVDAQGKIIEKDALRPSDKEALYKQISSHIE